MNWVCPHCRQPLRLETPESLRCSVDELTFPQIDGIWRLLPAEREKHFAPFCSDYEAIRAGEGRGWLDPTDYQKLPYYRGAEPAAAMWQQRARSFEFLLRQLGPHLVSKRRVVDLGAGSGWLSHQLARRGHELYAVDLLVNDWDGLGVIGCYEPSITPIQAEFDRLPFPDQSIDLIISNAAIHYSTDYASTLAALKPLLAPAGELIIMDTPFYPTSTAGQTMVRERHRYFAATYGRASDNLPHENFLTEARLSALCSQGGWHYSLHWHTPPWRRWLRRLRAQWQFGRAAAMFPLGRLKPDG